MSAAVRLIQNLATKEVSSLMNSKRAYPGGRCLLEGEVVLCGGGGHLFALERIKFVFQKVDGALLGDVALVALQRDVPALRNGGHLVGRGVRLDARELSDARALFF